MLASKRFGAVALTVLVGACATPIGVADAGRSFDAFVPVDASTTIDASGIVDASGTIDAATPPDAGGIATTRPIAPLSTATVTSRRPTLRWSLAAGADGARVELCSDRACTMIIATIDATGTSAAPTSDLPIGVVYWRLFSRTGAMTSPAPGPTWQFTVGARTAPVDTSWGSALDVNGDGYADLAVGAYGASSNTGRAYVYLGSASGLGTTPATSLIGPDGPDGRFGISVASAGDVNGDGYADLAVGANVASSNTGRAYVYLGSASGLGTTPATSLTGPDGPGGYFGVVASPGDVNGDGYADLAVGALGASSFTGRAYVYLGSASGLGTTPATSLTGPDGPGGNFGTVASAGDVNGDGYADLAVGAVRVSSLTGRAHVYLGSASGLVTTPATSLAGSDGPDGRFGVSLRNAGDVNGDGYADLAVGANGASSSTGRAYVYFGAASGLGATPATSLTSPDGPNGYFGIVASAGDVNGDGYADLTVGATAALSGVGRAHVYLGGPAGLGASPATSLTGPDPAVGDFGYPSTGGDVNGDGYADVAVGAIGALSSTGRAYLYVGGASGLGTTPATSLTGPDGELGQFGSALY